jgi:hypothetical protein
MNVNVLAFGPRLDEGRNYFHSVQTRGTPFLRSILAHASLQRVEPHAEQKSA